MNLSLRNATTVTTQKVNKKGWTKDEDAKLLLLIENNGTTGKWSKISIEMGYGRSGKQCRERYQNHLRPEINKGEWTEDEDKFVVEMKDSLGTQWAKIAKLLPGRSDNAIKNRWHLLNRYKVAAKPMKCNHADQKLPIKGFANLSCETSLPVKKKSTQEICSPTSSPASLSTFHSSGCSDKWTPSSTNSTRGDFNRSNDSKFGTTDDEKPEWLEKSSFSPLKELSFSHYNHWEHDHAACTTNSSPAVSVPKKTFSKPMPTVDTKTVEINNNNNNNNKHNVLKLRMLQSPLLKNVEGRKRSCAIRIFSPKRKILDVKPHTRMMMSSTKCTTLWSLQSASTGGDVGAVDDSEDDVEEEGPDNQWIDDFLSSDSVEISTTTSMSATILSPFSTSIRSLGKISEGVCPDHLCPSPFPPFSQSITVNNNSNHNNLRRRMEAKALARLSSVIPVLSIEKGDEFVKDVQAMDVQVDEEEFLDDVELPFAINSPKDTMNTGFQLISPATLFKTVSNRVIDGNQVKVEKDEFSMPFTVTSSLASMTDDVSSPLRKRPLLLSPLPSILNINNNNIITPFNASRSFKINTPSSDAEVSLLSPQLRSNRPPLHPLTPHGQHGLSLNNNQRSIQQIDFHL